MSSTGGGAAIGLCRTGAGPSAGSPAVFAGAVALSLGFPGARGLRGFGDATGAEASDDEGGRTGLSGPAAGDSGIGVVAGTAGGGSTARGDLSGATSRAEAADGTSATATSNASVAAGGDSGAGGGIASGITGIGSTGGDTAGSAGAGLAVLEGSGAIAGTGLAASDGSEYGDAGSKRACRSGRTTGFVAETALAMAGEGDAAVDSTGSGPATIGPSPAGAGGAAEMSSAAFTAASTVACRPAILLSRAASTPASFSCSSVAVAICCLTPASIPVQPARDLVICSAAATRRSFSPERNRVSSCSSRALSWFSAAVSC